MELKKIENNATYEMRFITDADAKTLCKIVNRTAKFATIQIGNETIRCKIKTSWDGIQEYCMPYGQYSMAPSFGALDKI
jgi:hypothetical protein